MVLAFSLQSDIKSIGAYAGFAAIIGLALLVLLYFAQAREIRRMSDWLERQEDRLRNVPAAGRPVVMAPGRAEPVPQGPASPAAGAPAIVAGAAPIATVAVPGARRVSVGAAGGGQGPAPAGGETVTTVLPGAVAAATVAGAMVAAGAEASRAPATDTAAVVAPAGRDDSPGAGQDESPPAGADDPPPARTEDSPADDRDDSPAPGAGAPPAPLTGASGAANGETPGPDGAKPAPGGRKPAPAGGKPGQRDGAAEPTAAVPLIARLAATAEPVGVAKALDTQDAAALETPQTAIVDPFVPGSGVAGGVASDPGISADRIRSPVLDLAPESSDPAIGSDEADAEQPVEAGAQEPPPLAPSTPAGARARFPPAPPPEVGAAAVAAATPAAGEATGEETLDADAGATTTRRQRHERPPAPPGDEIPPRPGGSVIRLLVAAIVIVAVLIFIATRVFSTSAKPTGPLPASITVAVLNGSHESGLASAVASTLGGLGFKRGLIGNALSHGHHVTLVGFTTPASRGAALLVAKDLAPNHTRVGPADAATKAVAEAQGGTPNVVVTIGSQYRQR